MFDHDKVRFSSALSLAEDILNLSHRRSEILLGYLGIDSLVEVNGTLPQDTHGSLEPHWDNLRSTKSSPGLPRIQSDYKTKHTSTLHHLQDLIGPAFMACSSVFRPSRWNISTRTWVSLIHQLLRDTWWIVWVIFSLQYQLLFFGINNLYCGHFIIGVYSIMAAVVFFFGFFFIKSP